MHEIPSPSVIFMDVFSLLTLAMFVLYSVSSGADVPAGKSVLTVIDVRLAIVPPVQNQSVSELVTFDVVHEGAGTGGKPRFTVQEAEFGLQIISTGELPGKLRLTIRRVIQPMAFSREIHGEVEIQGSTTEPVKGVIGQWDDPIIYSGTMSSN